MPRSPPVVVPAEAGTQGFIAASPHGTPIAYLAPQPALTTPVANAAASSANIAIAVFMRLNPRRR